MDAGVSLIVHLGVFGNGRSTDPHFAWHELVEGSIEGSPRAQHLQRGQPLPHETDHLAHGVGDFGNA